MLLLVYRSCLKDPYASQDPGWGGSVLVAAGAVAERSRK